jgi:hypothetical protein
LFHLTPVETDPDNFTHTTQSQTVSQAAIMYFVFVLACLALIGRVSATYGVDLSSRTYSSSFSCMVQNKYIFTVVRVYQSSGHTDPNGAATIKDAWAGGMHYVDGYIFPCYSCGNPEQQVSCHIPWWFHIAQYWPYCRVKDGRYDQLPRQ